MDKQPNATKRGLVYRLHNWCNEAVGSRGPDDIIEDAQHLMTEAAEALTARSETGRRDDDDAKERLRLAMLFIEEWANWWSCALQRPAGKPTTPEEEAASEKMAQDLGARARTTVINNRMFLARAPRSAIRRSKDVYAWVLERGDTGRPCYWTAIPNNEWSFDHAAAIRFSRRQDATDVLVHIVHDPSANVVEHCWIAPSDSRSAK